MKKYLNKRCCNIYVAISSDNKILGGVFYCSNLKEYGLNIKSNTHKMGAIRYLAVDDKYRGIGIGKALIHECINHAKKDKNKKIVLHTLDSMKEASHIYAHYGFSRFKDIDFRINGINVKGYSKTV